MSAHADEVADVEQLKYPIVIVAQAILAGIDLHTPLTILDVKERGLTKRADCHNAAGQGYICRILSQNIILHSAEARADISGSKVWTEIIGVKSATVAFEIR